MTTLCINPEVFKTAAGTLYLKSPGLAVIAVPQFMPEATRPFIESYGDVFDADDYVNDFYEGDYPRPDPGLGLKLTDGESLVKFAGQMCYLSFDKNRTRNDAAPKYFDNIMRSGHGSVMEHANYSMMFWGIDRACSHELVRHRAGWGFSQMSQRYVSGRTLRFVERPEYQQNERLHFEFEMWIDKAREQYDLRADLLRSVVATEGMSKTEARKAVNQSARNCLPNETETAMVITGNVRAWRNMIDQRANGHADKPIQKLVYSACSFLKELAPNFFGDYKATSPTSVTSEFRKV